MIGPKHLWEYKHPYYISTGNHYDRHCHTVFESWDEFIAEFGNSDLDYNWFVRWDWCEGEDRKLENYNGDDYYRHARFWLQRIAQRKSFLSTYEVKVCRADETAILEFLQPRWEYIRQVWAPLSGLW